MATPASNSNFDVEAYIGNYQGFTRLKRMSHIASQNSTLKPDVLRAAIDEVRNTTNTSMYLELIAMAADTAGASVRDDAWVEAEDKRASQRLEKLENDLGQHKTSLVKESIRMGHNDLGDFHSARGDFAMALKCYVRTRDYCTTSKHIITMCLNIIRVSIHMGNFSHVANYITKAESTDSSGSDPVLMAQLRVSAGLGQLEAKKYKLAARKFLETNPELGSSFHEIVSPQDVATYGALCALASFDRAELKAKVIDNTNFRSFLELVPEVREIVHDFYNASYASCLKTLEKLKPDLLLDMHLHDHVATLYTDIRSKALVQYFSPFVTVDMKRMAEAFNTPVMDLEKELATLIMAGQIPARIDSHNKVLHARHADQRTATFQKALGMGDDYVRDSMALLLRINLMRHDFVVKGQSGDAGLGPSKSSRQERHAVDRGTPSQALFDTGL